MEYPELISGLSDALRGTLPGQEYQHKMAHLQRITALKSPIRADVRHAAVLILLFLEHQQWQTVFIQRKSIPGDVHAGQISFPGGRMHSGESPEDTALRESSEEIGSHSEAIHVLGQLTRLHIPVSNHLVYPVVGYLDRYSGWQRQESEVDFILESPLDFLYQSEAKVLEDIPLRDGVVLRDVPGYSVEGHLIWGATAMILSEFSVVLERAKGA